MKGQLLGPLALIGAAGAARLGGLKQRAVLAQLLLRPGRAVSVDRLVEAVWGDEAGDGARHTLQVYVSTLRSAMESAEPGAGALLEHVGGGYRLAVAEDQVDASRLVGLARDGRAALERGEPAAAREAFEAALALWRGPALVDFPDERWAQAEARHLEELRDAIIEDRIEADLALGRHSALVGELEALVHEHPLRERLRGQLMLALYRSGRQADALAAYQTARRALAEEIGVDPGPELRDLQRRILSQDPGLRVSRPADEAAPASTGPVAFLTWLDPVGVEHCLDLAGGRDRFTLGRLPGSDVAVDWDAEASRAHAEILRFGGSWAVLDDGLSRNGTRVNGERVAPRRLLVDGDEILVGATIIVFHDPALARGSRTETRVSG